MLIQNETLYSLNFPISLVSPYCVLICTCIASWLTFYIELNTVVSSCLQSSRYLSAGNYYHVNEHEDIR